MSGRLRGMFAGFLALTLLDAVLRSKAGTEQIGTVLSTADNAFRRLTDPSIPAIPDLRQSGAGSSTSTSGAAPTLLHAPPSRTQPPRLRVA